MLCWRSTCGDRKNDRNDALQGRYGSTHRLRVQGRVFMLVTCAYFLGVLFLTADDLKAAPAKQGPAELQGKWKLQSLEIDGVADDLGGAQPRWVIKGNKVRYGGEELAQLTADATTTPKILDLSFVNPKRVYEAIYVVDQDTLKICLNKQTEG